MDKQGLSRELFRYIDIAIKSFKEDNNWDRVKTTDKLDIIKDNMELALQNSTLDKKELDKDRVLDSMVTLKTLERLLGEIEPDFIEKQVCDIEGKLELYSNILFYSLGGK